MSSSPKRLFILCLFLLASIGCRPMDYYLLHPLQSLPGIHHESEFFDRGPVRVHWRAHYPGQIGALPAVPSRCWGAGSGYGGDLLCPGPSRVFCGRRPLLEGGKFRGEKPTIPMEVPPGGHPGVGAFTGKPSAESRAYRAPGIQRRGNAFPVDHCAGGYPGSGGLLSPGGF